MFRILMTAIVLFILTNDSFAKSLKTYDPCEMLSMSDIEVLFPGSIIQITTHDKESANPLGTRRCFWEVPDDMKFVQLSISTDAESKAMKVSRQFEGNKAFIEGEKPITDVGDEAYYGGSGLKMGAGLHAIVKDKGVMLNVTVGLGRGNNDEQKHIEIETLLAKKVIEKL